jgi:hypothetical protein
MNLSPFGERISSSLLSYSIVFIPNKTLQADKGIYLGIVNPTKILSKLQRLSFKKSTFLTIDLVQSRAGF